MTERPKCFKEGCEREGYVMMYNQFFCGECIAEFNKKSNEEGLKNMMEILK